jgi:hypothetical protein
MLRIGIAASKMSKGGLLSYNLYVVLIACLFSLLVFLISGFFILLIIFMVSIILHALKPADFHEGWVPMYKFCLIVLAVVVGCFNVVAIVKNIQFTKSKT